MVYFAFLKYLPSEPHWRYILAAPDAETIDEWWREASANKDNDVKRLSPDFYSWNNAGKNAWDLSPSFNDRIIYSLLSDTGHRNIPTFDQPKRADVASGKSFYIRSKSNPELYWLAKNDQIWATTQGRTRFVFRIDRDDEDKKTVIIGSDEISIAPVSGESSKKYVSVSDDSEIVLSGHSCRMYYSDLKRNFLAEGETGNSGSAMITKVDGHGEEWELVN